ncbi:ribonuclease HII [Paracoccus aurantiacus]|uniref:Ribonuclease HII n=1 Tax=Paracoccus aurantiacus TaxID=2599412 RepID=A0A5C6S5K5_9RHOB|nr:ribonuclease HII [Paracoccus aurantiacus]TXB69786.1 ribonuclease HII [Paracoccus aurantiacus]
MSKSSSLLPDFAHETAEFAAGARRVAGVDEAGRGPLAGPVTAAAVVIDVKNQPSGLNDSKKLGPRARAAAEAEIRAKCDWAVVHVWVEEIDRLNILRASHAAMCRALAQLAQPPDMVLIDGNLLPQELPMKGRAIVKGDALSLSIAAASILAKTARDRVMVDLAQQFPGYGWERNAGYPTADHRRALNELGPTPYHRRSFAPVHNILCKVTNTTD